MGYLSLPVFQFSCAIFARRTFREWTFHIVWPKLAVRGRRKHSSACRRCSNYIFILLTPGFTGLGKDNCKTRQESFKIWDLVRLYKIFDGSLRVCHRVHITFFLSVDLVFNTMRPRQNGRHFTDDIFKCTFLNEMFELRSTTKSSLDNFCVNLWIAVCFIGLVKVHVCCIKPLSI